MRFSRSALRHLTHHVQGIAPQVCHDLVCGQKRNHGLREAVPVFTFAIASVIGRIRTWDTSRRLWISFRLNFASTVAFILRITGTSFMLETYLSDTSHRQLYKVGFSTQDAGRRAPVQDQEHNIKGSRLRFQLGSTTQLGPPECATYNVHVLN